MRKIIEIIEILRENKSLKSETQVAKILGMTQQALAHHKLRGSYPYEQLAAFCEREGVSLDWLLLGREPEKPAAESDLERRITELEKIIKKK